MPNSDARPEMEARRAKGLVARQATRPARARLMKDRQDIIAVLDLHLVGQVLPENWQSYRETLADALMALPDVDSKQLAETATELGRRLGRKEAAEEKCGCILGPVHTLGDHARKGDPDG